LAFHFPSAEQTIREWFRSYKVAEGKGVNTFAFGERVLPKVCHLFLSVIEFGLIWLCFAQAEALDVIEECSVAWGKDYKSTHRTMLASEFELPQRQDVEPPVHAPPKPRHH
jgi:hypothetical protein